MVSPHRTNILYTNLQTAWTWASIFCCEPHKIDYYQSLAISRNWLREKMKRNYIENASRYLWWQYIVHWIRWKIIIGKLQFIRLLSFGYCCIFKICEQTTAMNLKIGAILVVSARTSTIWPLCTKQNRMHANDFQLPDVDNNKNMISAKCQSTRIYMLLANLIV